MTKEITFPEPTCIVLYTQEEMLVTLRAEVSLLHSSWMVFSVYEIFRVAMFLKRNKPREFDNWRDRLRKR